MALYTDKQRKAVIKRALEAVQARLDGKTEIVLGTAKCRQNFDLDEKGKCLRLMRQIFETALGYTPFTWPFRAEEAWQTLKKLKPYKVALKDRKPGDILGNPGDPGHIALYVGDCYGDGRDLVCENTSSNKRGYPKAAGTKISSFEAFTRQHSSTTAYRLFAD